MKLCYECQLWLQQKHGEAAITDIFPDKQTMMKHAINKFNLTQFEFRIQNLIYLLVNRKKINVFFLLSSF